LEKLDWLKKIFHEIVSRRVNLPKTAKHCVKSDKVGEIFTNLDPFVVHVKREWSLTLKGYIAV